MASSHAWDMDKVRGMEPLKILRHTASLCIPDALLGARRAVALSGHGDE